MKKILVVLALIMGFSPAFAKNVPVQTLQDFTPANPPQTLLVKILSNVRISQDIMLHEGFYVLGQIQKGEKDSFTFLPVKYQNFHNEVFEIKGSYPAKYVSVIQNAGKSKSNVAKDSKILLDFDVVEEQADTSIGERFQGVDSSNGISAIVNKSDMVIYDDSIPQTMQEFPGVKLNTFDNSSNFNIPKKLIIEPEKRIININSLKESK